MQELKPHNTFTFDLIFWRQVEHTITPALKLEETPHVLRHFLTLVLTEAFGIVVVNYYEWTE